MLMKYENNSFEYNSLWWSNIFLRFEQIDLQNERK